MNSRGPFSELLDEACEADDDCELFDDELELEGKVLELTVAKRVIFVDENELLDDELFDDEELFEEAEDELFDEEELFAEAELFEEDVRLKLT